MDKQALKRTRDAIAASQTYDQTTYAAVDMKDDVYCYTPACVAGHAVAAHGYTVIPDGQCVSDDCPGADIQEVARVILGLDDGEMYAMFDGEPFRTYVVTKEDALNMLDRAIETDKVDW